ncbi:hypothetical protein KIH74_01075 [Kineosporia sp. J2-2]|uniref:Esterase-like activity of phytase n=1 Tax=Kineosporia corallincola TaxID=2835133 RepID=A0ABS5T8U2_9ACTN|nr:hypothetical protein [Kineosporia corallincola]MBT0767494.1 hypothetical protein [Kineosporia corallincola]
MRVAVVVLTTLALVLTDGAAQAKTRTDRVIQDDRIAESSGLAPSLLHDDVLWTHNDSGNPNQIYALAGDGSTAATVTIAGEDARDWEAIASFELDGTALLAIADIGDNDAKHDSVRIAIVPEPRALADTTITPQRVLRLTYPGGARDAETLLADPRTGRLYVVSKTLFGSEVYAVPQALWPGRTTGTSRLTEMTDVGRTGAGLVTDGAFTPDGNIVLRGYGSLSVIAGPDRADGGQLETLASKALPDQEQGESIAVVDDGAYALVGSEGENSPILRVKLPAVATEDEQGTTPGATASSSSSTESAAAATEKLRDLAGGDGGLRWLVGAGAALVALVAVSSIAILLRPSRSRRRRR